MPAIEHGQRARGIVTQNGNAWLGSVPQAQSGIAAGTFTASRQTGSVLGVALFGTLLASLHPSTGLEITVAICAGIVPVVLLHGFPSSSRMWEPLLTRLGDAFHMIAPDYPGFGHSDTPDPVGFAYTFDHLADIIDGFTTKLGLTRYVLVMQDYGGPIGFRLALAHPDRVQALIVQNAVAHEDGLGPLWEARRQFWTNRAKHEAALRENFFSPAATRLRHVGKSPRPENYDPDHWSDELAFLQRPGQADIQTDLFFDYQTNLTAYPAWQEWLRAHQPPLLVTWGRYDPSFEAAEATAYKRDVPAAEVHLLDGGHFALEDQPDQIAALTRDFLTRVLGGSPGA